MTNFSVYKNWINDIKLPPHTIIDPSIKFLYSSVNILSPLTQVIHVEIKTCHVRAPPPLVILGCSRLLGATKRADARRYLGNPGSTRSWWLGWIRRVPKACVSVRNRDRVSIRNEDEGAWEPAGSCKGQLIYASTDPQSLLLDQDEMTADWSGNYIDTKLRSWLKDRCYNPSGPEEPPADFHPLQQNSLSLSLSFHHDRPAGFHISLDSNAILYEIRLDYSNPVGR